MAAKTAKGDNIYAAIGLNLGALGISGCFARVRVSGSKAAVQIKAKMLYEEIDRNALFYGIVKKENRSNMNVTFNLYDNNLSDDFNKLCEENGINGLTGHRSVGGYRASLYNALPKKSVEFLIKLMKKFEDKKND